MDENFKKCYRCYRAKKACFCADIQPFSTQTRFVILIHPMEAKREKTGTGRLTSLSLLNSELIEGVNFTHDPRVNKFFQDPQYFPYLLYPGKEVLNISLAENRPRVQKLKEEIGPRQLVLFLLDGTWPCARKMMKLSLNLQRLPRICFVPASPSQFWIKHQPHESCLSTIEATAQFLEEWEWPENPSPAFRHSIDSLLSHFQRMVRFQIDCAQNPSLSHYTRGSFPFKNPLERKKSKKWENRNLFFN